MPDKRFGSVHFLKMGEGRRWIKEKGRKRRRKVYLGCEDEE